MGGGREPTGNDVKPWRDPYTGKSHLNVNFRGIFDSIQNLIKFSTIIHGYLCPLSNQVEKIGGRGSGTDRK